MALKKKHPGGRPTKYREQYAHQAYVACRERGASISMLARMFQIERGTLYDWKERHPEFRHNITVGLDEWNNAIAERSIAKKIKGFRYTETHTTKDANGKITQTKTIRKYVIPDTATLIFYLKNRLPERWKDIQQLEIPGVSDLAQRMVEARKRQELGLPNEKALAGPGDTED